MEPLPTLEGILREVGISEVVLERKCSDEHLKSISLFLDWRSVAPHLGLSERDIEDIKSENTTESERRLKVLQVWKRKYGYAATLKKLVVALLKVENTLDAEQVCRLLKTHTDTGTGMYIIPCDSACGWGYTCVSLDLDTSKLCVG